MAYQFNPVTQQFDPGTLIGNVKALAYGGVAAGLNQPTVLFTGLNSSWERSRTQFIPLCARAWQPGKSAGDDILITRRIRDIVLDPRIGRPRTS